MNDTELIDSQIRNTYSAPTDGHSAGIVTGYGEVAAWAGYVFVPRISPGGGVRWGGDLMMRKLN